MTNQFKKLLKNEFGISIYRKFFDLINERIMSGKINYIGDKLVDIENNSVYKEMCSILKTKDRECLMKMQEKLKGASFYEDDDESGRRTVYSLLTGESIAM